MVLLRLNAVRGATLLCFLSALLFALPAKVKGASREAVPAPQTESRFVIADLDGDVLPDFATVHGEVGGYGKTNYWIQLQLSQEGQQSIRLVAPAGGLSIQARDVNGDHVPDLLLATAWSKDPVAILLNDGHGGFLRVAPDQFPAAFTTTNQSWGSVVDQTPDLLGLPSQARATICMTSKGPHRGRSPTARIPSAVNFFYSQFLFSVSAGRAPPTNAVS